MRFLGVHVATLYEMFNIGVHVATLYEMFNILRSFYFQNY